jgi:hypothetical protein
MAGVAGVAGVDGGDGTGVEDGTGAAAAGPSVVGGEDGVGMGRQPWIVPFVPRVRGAT